MQEHCFRNRLILLFLMAMIGLFAYGQTNMKNGSLTRSASGQMSPKEGEDIQVRITADPESVCAGDPVNLHAEAYIAPVVYDYEQGFQGWTTLDGNNDGYQAWDIYSTNGGSGCMRAYANSNSQFDYLVSPQITLGIGKFSFYARVGSDNYNDTFRVYLFQKGDDADDTPPTPSNFTIELTNGNVSPTSSYAKYEYDLSSYQGQGYVAIVYTAAANQYFLLIDHITFFEGNTLLNSFYYAFETHTLQDWTPIDADGDGHTWLVGKELYDYVPYGHNLSSDYVISQTRIPTNDGTSIVLAPDNYLVSPTNYAIQQGASISFWACAQEPSMPSEHFGVAVSTTVGTTASAFSTIQEWTMTAKGRDESFLSQGDNPKLGTSWYKYTVDLSEYAGQSIWIAIRHFNVTNGFAFNVDDITITLSPEIIVPLEDISFVWDNGMQGADITVYPTVTTTYLVTAYRNNASIGSAQHTIMVYPDPELSITTNSGDATICEGDTLILYANVNVNVNPEDYVMVGDILCEDNSIVKPSNYVSSGKTAKAVIVFVDATGKHGWAVGLTQDSQKWCSQNVAVPGVSSYSNWEDALWDLDGYTNTQMLRNFSDNPGNPSCPAAATADFDNGWYLPSIGQMSILYGEFTTINNSLGVVGGTPVANAQHWSSTMSNVEYSMTITFGNGAINTSKKNVARPVRYIIDF